VRASALASAAVFAAACSGVALIQPRLASIVHRVKESGDTYALPPPAQLRASTLGWNASAVDLLWARLLTEYGTHWQEHREFKETPLYADAILELEPTFWPLYKLIDTLLVYRPLMGTEGDARLARAYLERGTQNLPADWHPWVKYGQFMAFIAPSFLRDQAERDAWRKLGAEALGHAVALGADSDQALVAASLFTTGGARELAIRALERAYAFTPEGSEAHQQIAARLAGLEARAERDRNDEANRAIDAAWQRDLPYVDRDLYLLLGPLRDAGRCSGVEAARDPSCAVDWTPFVAASARVSAPESSAGSP
jgi:hypothetical protein